MQIVWFGSITSDNYLLVLRLHKDGTSYYTSFDFYAKTKEVVYSYSRTSAKRFNKAINVALWHLMTFLIDMLDDAVLKGTIPTYRLLYATLEQAKSYAWHCIKIKQTLDFKILTNVLTFS